MKAGDRMKSGDRMKKVLRLIPVVVLTFSNCFLFLEPALAGSLDEKAVKILKSACSTYQNATTFSGKIDAELVGVSDSAADDRLREYFVVLQKPNKYYVFFNAKKPASAISDGHDVEYYVHASNKYMIASSPASIAEGFDAQEFDLVTGAALQKSLLSYLVSADPYAEITRNADSLSFIGAEKSDGQECNRLSLQRSGHAVDLWITAEKNPKLSKVQFKIGKAPSQSAAAITFAYKNQMLNIAVAPSKFAPAHPDNAVRLQSFFRVDPVQQLVGKVAPNVTLLMQNGTSVKLSSLRDRIVVLDFWATWCPPCVASMPIFAKASQAFKSQGVTFIPVNQGESQEMVDKFMHSHDLSMQCAMDKTGELGPVFHTDAIPETVFIGKDGVIKAIHVGIPQDFKERFVSDLTALVAGRSLPRQGEQ